MSATVVSIHRRVHETVMSASDAGEGDRGEYGGDDDEHLADHESDVDDHRCSYAGE